MSFRGAAPSQKMVRKTAVEIVASSLGLRIGIHRFLFLTLRINLLFFVVNVDTVLGSALTSGLDGANLDIDEH